MTSSLSFSGHLLQTGANTTGIEVPGEIATALGKRAPVKVEVNGFAYRGTLASMGGKVLISFSAEKREASGIKGGDPIDVRLERDEESRTVELPVDLAAALEAVPGGRARYDALAPSHKKAHVAAVEGAKTADTRQRRIARIISTLQDG